MTSVIARTVQSAAHEVESEAAYNRRVGDHLRSIRRQKRLSLQEVESLSAKEFKASVLGAYERGERAISVPRLRRLATCYGVPVEQLLPHDGPGAGEAESTARSGVALDLRAVQSLQTTEGVLLRRYLAMIQVQRQDFNGRVLTIRGDDLRLLACVLGVGEEQARARFATLGVCHTP